MSLRLCHDKKQGWQNVASQTAEAKQTNKQLENELNLTDKQRTLIMAPLLFGGFIALLNETLLNVAFPQLMSTLNVSTSTVQWLGTAYMLVIGILVPIVAFLLKTFPTKTLYLMAMILFVSGTIFCGFSQTFPVLLISRIIQGAGTGMLIPIMVNTVLDIYPLAKRGAAIGISMMVVVVAPGIGPILSGLILQYLDWHWLFFLILPFGLLAIVLGMITLKNVSVLTKPKIDVLSIALSSIGFGGLISGICSIVNIGFFNLTVMVSLLCGIGGLLCFSIRQFALKQPMLELRTFRYPMFTLGTAIIFITFMMPFAVNIILPTFMQSYLGIIPMIAGFALLPGSIINGAIAPLSGRLYDKIAAKPLAVAGFVALVTAMFFLSHISSAVTLTTLIALHICIFIGVGLIFTPIQANSLNQLPKEHNAHGVAIINTLQQISAAFGSSLFIGLMGAVQAKNLEKIQNPDILQQQAAIISGVNAAFTAALIMVVIGLILSFFIKRRNSSENNG
jgi:DHA2 family lincomycin resistance protein-like MFS transporter